MDKDLQILLAAEGVLQHIESDLARGNRHNARRRLAELLEGPPADQNTLKTYAELGMGIRLTGWPFQDKG